MASHWPASIRTAAHPQHELVHLLFNRNRCNVCRGALAGMLGYRCDVCNFDVHCGCLPYPSITTTPNARHPPPAPAPPRPRPSYSYYHGHHYGHGLAHYHGAAPPRQPPFQLTLSEHFDMLHQHGAQAVYPPPQQYPPPQYNNNGYYNYGRGAEPGGAPTSYNHLQQQQDYQTTNNNRGGYADDYTGDIGDADDYYDCMADY